MAKYMINIIYGNPGQSQHPQDDQFVMRKYMEWSEKIKKQTVIAHKLFDDEGRRLEMRAGSIVDGPYTETKESIGAFYIVEAETYEQAVQLARECPTLLYQGGSVEVRRVEM